MLFAKILLAFTAVMWISYGLWLFINPQALAYSGLGIEHWSAIVEVQAMYGLGEAALGVFALLGVLFPKRYLHSALLLWCMLYSALAAGRIIGILQWEGSFLIELGAAGLPESYNAGALYFLELPSAILFAIALLKTHAKKDI